MDSLLGSPLLIRGLAVYDGGRGPVVLLMPSPQGVARASDAASPLARHLLDLGYRVVTFDPPGAFASTRAPRLGLAEMSSCAREALAASRVDGPVAAVGHSQATLCLLALALDSPGSVSRAVLVGPVDGGWRTTRAAGGMPWCWAPWDPRRWRFAWQSLPLVLGRGTAQRAERFRRFFVSQSLFDRSVIAELTGPSGGAPARLRWQVSVREVDLRRRLAGLPIPVLVCVGALDPQTPPGSAAAIAAALPGGVLRVFDRSGHYPHVEQADEFRAVLGAFLAPVVQPHRVGAWRGEAT